MPALKNLLEGRPFRCPLHVALVHLPIALFPISLLLDIGSHVCPASELYFVRGAFVALMAAIVTALLAAVFGLVDYLDIRADHPAKSTATRHLVLNVVALAIFAVSAWLRRDHLDSMTTALAPIWISVAGLAVLSYSGYLGGELVYADGIAVGRHRRKTRSPRETLRVSSAGARRVAVAPAGSIGEGESLRVEVDGVVVAIARLAGTYHAFQEFCTHRYGPLSEGRLADCEVTCPWHGSRFDVRTGKVTGGPAKLDLPTYAVEISEGKIWIEPPVQK